MLVLILPLNGDKDPNRNGNWRSGGGIMAIKFKNPDFNMIKIDLDGSQGNAFALMGFATEIGFISLAGMHMIVQK